MNNRTQTSQTLQWKKRGKPFFAHLKCKYHKFKNSSCLEFWCFVLLLLSAACLCLVFVHPNPICLHADFMHHVVSTWNSGRCSRIPIVLFSTATWSKLFPIWQNSSQLFFVCVYIQFYTVITLTLLYKNNIVNGRSDNPVFKAAN